MNLKELRQRFQEDKLPRQLKDPKKETMVSKYGKTIVIDKTKEKEYLAKGWKLAEDAPANAVGDGSNVALPPTHEPGIQPKKKKKEENKFSTFLTRYQKESFSERELVLQTSNDETLYRKQIQPIILNLARKKAKGVFDKNLAVKLFRYAVDNKVKELAGPSSRMVPGTIRNKVADKLLSIFDGEIDDKVKDLK
jgi:hypothetical protein|tara:strand:- start:262 stop:843 length:582 start_codon:yes stop_codon:yes gene_type:complete